MRGFIGKSLLVVCGSCLLLTAYARADLFQNNTKTNNSVSKQKYDLKAEAQTMINKQQQSQQDMVYKLKKIIQKANIKPKDVPDPENLTVNKQDNAVWFYFTKENFNATNVQNAISIARQHNLYPVIYYLSDQCSFANGKDAENFFYQHGLQYIFTPNYSDNVEFELSCDQNILNKIKDNNEVYFKFMSVKGLHGSGYYNDFEKVYRSCFIK
ncbi:MAG: hypothetical protein QXI16_02435 [Sulfolobaceae archaeon]